MSSSRFYSIHERYNKFLLPQQVSESKINYKIYILHGNFSTRNDILEGVGTTYYATNVSFE